MQIKLKFLGAVREVTGSMHLISWKGKKILFDCGLNQGKRKEAFEKNRNLPLEPADIDMLVLSHAHIDHSGNIPTIVRQGFKGPIYATPATVELCNPMLFDSAHIQEQDVRYVNKKRIKQGKKPFEPLYVHSDVEKALKLFKAIPYLQPFEIVEGLKITFYDAGHILGSAITSFDFEDENRRFRLLFTGDLGRKNIPILRDPMQVNFTNVLVCESTYGDRIHEEIQDVKSELNRIVKEVYSKKSKLIIPSFSVGRTQTLVYLLHELYDEGKIPKIPVYVDSPLSVRATEVFRKHVECYDAKTWNKYIEEQESPFSFSSLRYIMAVEESKMLNSTPGPLIIISASGMCESGRILHHLAHNIENPDNVVLFVGFQAQNTLGRRLVDGISPVKIFGDRYTVKAKIYQIEGLSAHADKNELIEYISNFNQPPEHIYIVHGEEEQSLAFADHLHEAGFSDVTVPFPKDEVTLNF